jgi:uncharacterized FlaG/YvyC family protein
MFKRLKEVFSKKSSKIDSKHEGTSELAPKKKSPQQLNKEIELLVKDIDRLEENLKPAIEWVAAEYGFLQKLQQELKIIEKPKHTRLGGASKGRKAYRKAATALRYIRKCEGRVDQDLEKVRGKIEKFVQDIAVALNTYPISNKSSWD